MTGIPPHHEPQNQAEREIAMAMTLAHRLFEEIRATLPDLPPTAISSGFINYGTQIGCKYADPVAAQIGTASADQHLGPRHGYGAALVALVDNRGGGDGGD